ncbi:MAG: hypothetical protein HA489_07320 [Archaeoglobales archaeon]|nr:hypothetical protein [Archaeoglobales archaeon]
MRLVLAILLFGILAVPVLALEELNSNHFTVEYSIDPKSECYTAGERIYAKIEIHPKNLDYRVLIGGEEDNPRTYYFWTDLVDPVWTLTVGYYKAGDWSEDVKGRSASIDVKYFEVDEERKGISKVVANLTGITPQCKSRLCEFSLINASCELCTPDALPNVTIKVANEAIFKNEIKSLRVRLAELEEKLKQENLYSEEDFRNVTAQINSAEDLVIVGKFLDADKRLSEAEQSLNFLSNLTNRKLVENLYNGTKAKLDGIKGLLVNSSVQLEKIKESEKYVDLVHKQKDYESRLGELEAQIKEARNLIDEGKYENANEKLETIGADADKLLKDVEDLMALIKTELEKKTAPLISLPSVDPYMLLLVISAAVIVVLGAFGVNRIRKRRKWDELR